MKNVQTVSTRLSVETIDALFNKLFPLTQVSEAEKIAHIQNIKKSKQYATQSRNIVRFPGEEKKSCPRCGGKLIVRTSKKGKNVGQSFYGCSNFPKCRYIENCAK